MFRDIESGEIVTIKQLEKEYNENRRNLPEEFNYSFIDYIKNCMTENNGTLEKI